MGRKDGARELPCGVDGELKRKLNFARLREAVNEMSVQGRRSLGDQEDWLVQLLLPQMIKVGGKLVLIVTELEHR